MWRTIACAVLIGACGGGGSVMPDAPNTACKDMGGSACFQLPTAPLQTHDGAPSALGCGPVVPGTSSAVVTYTGNVAAYGANTPIPGALIKVHTAPDFANPVSTATSAADATYSLPIPSGTPELMWNSVEASGFLTSYVHAYRPDLMHGDIASFNLRLFIPDNLESAALLVKEVWDPAFTVVAGYAYDCNRMIIVHAAVALSSTSGQRTFVPGASLYYGAPGVVPLAVPPDERGDTNDNGVFAVFRVPPGQQLFIQIWGFVDAAAQARGEAGLTLVGEWPVHAVANSVVVANVWVNK